MKLTDILNPVKVNWWLIMQSQKISYSGRFQAKVSYLITGYATSSYLYVPKCQAFMTY